MKCHLFFRRLIDDFCLVFSLRALMLEAILNQDRLQTDNLSLQVNLRAILVRLSPF